MLADLFFLGVPSIPDVSGQALALWLSFVSFLIQLYMTSYMAPILLLMSRWVVVLDFYKVEETYSGQDSQMFFGWFPSQHLLSLFWYICDPWNLGYRPRGHQYPSRMLWLQAWLGLQIHILNLWPCWKLAGFRPAYILMTVLCTYPGGTWEARVMTIYIHNPGLLVIFFIFRCICSGKQFCIIGEHYCCWIVLNGVREVVDVQDK